jgi:hypothetical protein
MNVAATVFLCVVAVLATALAVVAGTNEAAVLPAALVAVAAGALLLAGVIERTRWPRVRSLPAATADPARVRSSLEAGVWGRPALISLLDNLERAGGNPTLANPSIEELARLQALSPEEFRRYLAARVNDLERRT